MTHIKIAKCSVSKYWYNDKVGQTFPLVNSKTHEVKESPSESNTCYVVLHDNKEHVVVADDCEAHHE